MADRSEWLAWRRTGITATDTAGILGLSRWSSPWSIWADKAGLSPQVDASDAMEFGSRAEAMLSAWFTDRTGLHVLGEQTWCHAKDEPWMLATVDGFACSDPDGSLDSALGGVEHKTTTDTADQWDEHIPDHIMCQVQWQMAVTGLPKTWLTTLHLGFRLEFRVRVIERDEADIAALTALCQAFWTDHCLTGKPPHADGTQPTTDALRAAYPGDPTLDVLHADNELRAVHERLCQAKAKAKAWEAIADLAENEIKAALGDRTVLANGLDTKGRPVVLASWKPGERTSIDTKALAADHPDIAAGYVRTTQTRTLRVTTPKEQ